MTSASINADDTECRLMPPGSASSRAQPRNVIQGAMSSGGRIGAAADGRPLALVAWGSAHDRFSWSGTPYFVRKELERRFGAVEVIETPRLDRWILRASSYVGFGNLLEREP